MNVYNVYGHSYITAETDINTNRNNKYNSCCWMLEHNKQFI